MKLAFIALCLFLAVSGHDFLRQPANTEPQTNKDFLVVSVHDSFLQPANTEPQANKDFLVVSVHDYLRQPADTEPQANKDFLIHDSLRQPVDTEPQANKDFDFYVFASEWAGSVCKTNSCDKEETEGVKSDFWNVHGLWPSDGQRGLNYCSDEKFDPSQVNSIRSDLSAYWSGLYSSANSFHGHEWEKHGTCSGMSQIDYFSTTMQVAQQLDVYGALQRHNIIPGIVPYTCKQVAKALQQEYGVTKFTLKVEAGYLVELQLCVDKDFQVQNCPSSKICKGVVRYPALNLKSSDNSYLSQHIF